MGESAEALKEWSIVKGISSGPGLADRFLNAMQKNMRDLNSESNGLKRFNQALGYAQNNAKDLAVIQLKKVISVHSNMTKAYNLPALLYLEDGKYEQAEKVLQKCLEVDRGNDTAIRYLKSIRELDESDASKSLGTVGADDREQLIIPVRFRDYGTYLSNALYIVLGLVLGILIAWFVIVPGRVDSEMSAAEAANRSNAEKIAELESRLAVESRPATSEEPLWTTEAPSTERFVAEETMPVIEINTSWVKNQVDVEEAVADINATPNRYADTIFKILRVDQSQLSLTYQTHYRNIVTILFAESTYQRMQAMAYNYEATGDDENAAAFYEALSLLHPEVASFRSKAGQLYERLGESAKAANFYWQCATVFPETEIGRDAAYRYCVLTGKSYVPIYTGEVPIEKLREPLDCDEMLSKIGGADPEETAQE